jgi:hypothetical protein
MKNIVKILIFILIISIPNLAIAKNNEHMGVGGFLGFTTSTAGDNAIKDFDDSARLENGFIIGGNFFYAPENSNGAGIEGIIETFNMNLSGDFDYGKLRITPVMALFKFQGFPSKKTGFAGHGSIGVGIAFTDFEKGEIFHNINRYTRAHSSVETDNTFVFQIGGGVDYFFNRKVSMNLDCKWLYGVVPIRVTVEGYRVDDMDKINASNLQLVMGATYWIW